MDTIDRMQTFVTLMMDHIPTKFYDWLKSNGFFVLPASINHHGNYEGGLFDHSLAVATELQRMTKANKLTWENPRSPLIVGMFHDLCKSDQYSFDCHGGYEYDATTLFPGHGETSVMLLAQNMQLTPEEVVCIRWHMGAFDDKSNWDYYSRAVKVYPNVLWTHTADMVASQVQGV